MQARRWAERELLQEREAHLTNYGFLEVFLDRVEDLRELGVPLNWSGTVQIYLQVARLSPEDHAQARLILQNSQGTWAPLLQFFLTR